MSKLFSGGRRGLDEKNLVEKRGMKLTRCLCLTLSTISISPALSVSITFSLFLYHLYLCLCLSVSLSTRHRLSLPPSRPCCALGGSFDSRVRQHPLTPPPPSPALLFFFRILPLSSALPLLPSQPPPSPPTALCSEKGSCSLYCCSVAIMENKRRCSQCSRRW